MPFSDEQRLVLQQAYSENWDISGGNLNTLAARLGVDYRRIRGWFGHGRVENGQALLEIFSKNIRNAVKKALNSFCTA